MNEQKLNDWIEYFTQWFMSYYLYTISIVVIITKWSFNSSKKIIIEWANYSVYIIID